MKNEMIPVYRSTDRPGFADSGILYTLVTDRDYSHIEHSHDFYEILFIFAGKTNHKVGGAVYPMHSGDVYFLRPGDRHIPLRDSAHIRACMFSVLPNVMTPLLSAYGLTQFCKEKDNGFLINMSARQQEAILYSLRQFPFLDRERKDDEVKIIIGQVCQAILQTKRETRMNWLDKILGEMNSREKLAEGVPALQTAANLSHAQLCRVFEKQLGQTPRQFIIALRMSYAYDAICNSDEPFEEIASSIGYASFSHFSKLFKQTYGITPSALRKSTRKFS